MAAEADPPGSPATGEPCEELGRFAQRRLRRELEDLSSRLQRSMRDEMERFIGSALASKQTALSPEQRPLGSLAPRRASKSSRCSAASSSSPESSAATEGPHAAVQLAAGSPEEGESPAAALELPGFGLPRDLMLPGSPTSSFGMDALRMSSTMMDDPPQPPGGRRSTSSSQQRRGLPTKLPAEALELESVKDELPRRQSSGSEDDLPRRRSAGSEGLGLPGCASADLGCHLDSGGGRRHGRRRSAPLGRSRSRSSGELEQLPTFIGFKRQGSTERWPSLSRSSTAGRELSPGVAGQRRTSGELSPYDARRRKGSTSGVLGRSFSQSTIDVDRIPTLLTSGGSKSDAASGQDSLMLDAEGPMVESTASCLSSISSLPETGYALARSRLLHLVESSRFDWVSGILVSLNAISIGWQTDYMANYATDHLPVVFRVFDALFCVVFTVELALRIVAYGKSFVCGPEWRWNVFDVAMVTMQIFEEIAALIAIGSHQHSSSVPGSNFSYLRLLRLVRLVRVLRIVRVLRFIGELRKLVCSIGNSLQSLAWTLVLLIFMLYVVGICFTQLVSHHIRSADGLTRGEEVLQEQFGSLGSSVLSLFQAMSGGMDWDDLSRPLGEVHGSLQLLFALYIAFAVLAMLNVVTGVFVDSAVQSSTKDQEDDFVLRMRELYNKTNLNGDGRLTWGAFELQLQKQDVAEYFQNVGINVSEAKSLFELLDVHDSGEIDADEFVMGCLRLRGPAKSVDLVTLMYDNKRMLGKLHEDVLRLLQVSQQHQCSVPRPLFPPPSLTVSHSLPLADA